MCMLIIMVFGFCGYMERRSRNTLIIIIKGVWLFFFYKIRYHAQKSEKEQR